MTLRHVVGAGPALARQSSPQEIVDRHQSIKREAAQASIADAGKIGGNADFGMHSVK
jgi:hypothetical protein